MPQLTPFTSNFQNIVDHKAEITFAEPSVVYEFQQANPGKIKEIASDKPLRIFGNNLVVRRGEIDLKLLLDAGMQEIVFNGTVDKILKKYEKKSGFFLRTAKPYEAAPQ
jgi:ABC-type amino acid transport substrate-binding protein